MPRRHIFLIAAVSLVILLLAIVNFGSVFAQQRTATPSPAPRLTSTPAPMATDNPPPLRDYLLLQDTSLVARTPGCVVPCWHGITPGKTSWENALTILEADPSIENLTIQESEDSTAKAAEFRQRGGSVCCQVFTQDDETVSVIFLRLTPDIVLSQLIEAQGEPQYLVGSPYSDDQAVMNLIYPDNALVVYVFVAGEDGSLSADSEIIGVLYLTHPDMDLLIDTSSLFTWKGYQSFESYHDQGFDVTPSVTLTPTPP
jgi:hypothetical protein